MTLSWRRRLTRKQQRRRIPKQHHAGQILHHGKTPCGAPRPWHTSPRQMQARQWPPAQLPLHRPLQKKNVTDDCLGLCMAMAGKSGWSACYVHWSEADSVNPGGTSEWGGGTVVQGGGDGREFRLVTAKLPLSPFFQHLPPVQPNCHVDLSTIPQNFHQSCRASLRPSNGTVR